MQIVDGRRIEIVSFNNGEFAIALILPLSTLFLNLEDFETLRVTCKLSDGSVLKKGADKYTWTSDRYSVNDYQRVSKIYDLMVDELQYAVVLDRRYATKSGVREIPKEEKDEGSV
jgi:hypothetical protein